ncbi:hypothetical protein J2S55_009688 [Streptosporangium brasiliense]|uniref:Uncharacterized protein n=1 Tax=Streptosporangium brasiliense TaxID=47480 RepID=A0ABT9RPY9_9ACTN|nr:hypothetical protein [Streptosporangium brasiliense]
MKLCRLIPRRFRTGVVSSYSRGDIIGPVEVQLTSHCRTPRWLVERRADRYFRHMYTSRTQFGRIDCIRSPYIAMDGKRHWKAIYRSVIP